MSDLREKLNQYHAGDFGSPSAGFDILRAARRGDLFTRAELEEISVMASAKEREACAIICDNAALSRQAQIDAGKHNATQNERWRCGKQQSQILADTIRARSESEEVAENNRDEGIAHELDSLIEAALLRINGEADLQSLDNFIHLNFPKQYAKFFKEAAVRNRSEKKESE